MIKLKNNGFKLAGLIIAIAVVSGCDKEFSNSVEDASANYNSGGVDFSEYVSIGDSLTAGFADGTLYLSAQKNSYPAILAKQFAIVGGGDFKQPLVNDEIGGLIFGGAANPKFGTRLVLNANPKNPPTDLSPKGPEPIEGTPTTEVFASLTTGPFNNMGVPGATLLDLQSTSLANAAGLAADPATANPYFMRFASSASASIISDVKAQTPSFFTLWIGNNDILAYATNGGDGTDQKDTPAVTPGSNDITNPDNFKTNYDSIVDSIITSNSAAKGVLINLPDIKSIPYFSVIPFNPVPLDQATAAQVNAGYVAYNAAIQTALSVSDAAQATKRTISFAAGQNAVVIEDETLTVIPGLPNIRQATAEDLITFESGKIIGTLADPNNPASAWGLGVALSDKYVLIPTEIAAIDVARVKFNETISEKATAETNLILFDVAKFMSDLKTNGYDYGTGFVTSKYASGGAFSLDGVHPTARGYAIVANQIITTINSGFSANIPTVNPGDYTTIYLK